MAKIVVLAQQGIEPSVGRYDFLIQGDPSVLGLAAAIGSLAVQTDSATPFAQWQKLTSSDTGWSLVAQSANAGAASSSGAYRASAFSVPVDGTTDSKATLATLTGTTMPQTGGPYGVIIGPGEALAFSTDTTIPANAFIQGTGGTLKPASGKKITLMAQPTGNAKMFDVSAGGFVLAGVPMTADPTWWGADKTGATDASTAVFHAMAMNTNSPYGTVSNVNTGGGRARFPSGTYKLSQYGTQYGDAYSYLTVEGDGPSTLFLNGTSHIANTFTGMFSFYGSGNFTLKQLRFKGFRMSGVDTNDQTRHIVIDTAENVHFEDIYLENNACEGIVSITGESALQKVTFNNCHAKNVGVGSGLAAFNLNAQYMMVTGCTFDSCGNGVENEGHFTNVTNCQFMNMGAYGIMMQSTWSGYLDASFNQVNTFGGQVSNCTFTNYNGRGVVLPDYTGHANASYPTHGPANLDGGLGKIMIVGNLFDRLAIGIYGGADKQGEIECSGNIFSGQYDGLAGPQNVALCPQGGTWNIHHNTFTKGSGIQWTSLIGFQIATPHTDRQSIVDNIVINKCWSGAAAMRVNQDTTIRGTRFLDLDGTIAAAPTAVMYRITDAGSVDIVSLKTSEWVWSDPAHVVSQSEPTILPVNGNTLPATFSFKPGDVLVNRGSDPTVGWFNKKCVTGGTLNPTPLTMTASGTSGTNTITVSASTGLMQYGWIYFPAIPAITPKRIATTVTSGTITLTSNLEATVTAGTAVAWATPTWITDRDANSLTIASQAAGDLLYASSTTNFTRLGKGSDGQFLTLSSGVPAWSSSIARYDAGNTSTALTVTWTDVRQEQKITLTSATPTVTIAGIPSGGYLILDVFQDGTGGRAPTFAQSGMTSLVWVGGNTPPTITPTASVSDRLLFHNDGTRCVANVVWQNL